MVWSVLPGDRVRVRLERGMGGVDPIGCCGAAGIPLLGPNPKFKNTSKPPRANIITANILTRRITLRFCLFCLRSLVSGAGGISNGAM